MPSLNGWIKFYRQTLDNPVVMRSPNHLAVWMYILANATPLPYRVVFEGKETMIQPGQLITSRAVIANRLGIKNKFGKIDDNKVQRILATFETAQQIAQQGTNKNRLITVLNWDKYQLNAQQNGQQMHSECTTNAQQMHTNGKEKNIKNLYTSEISEIVGYLNKTAGTRFRASTANTIKCISARLREGYSVEEIFIVVDSKCDEWLGTDQAKYLRPETLFGSKFEGYLNAATAQPPEAQTSITDFLTTTTQTDDLSDYEEGIT